MERSAEVRATVLVVDDLKGVRQILASVLGKAGYATIEAEDGQSALDLVRTHSPDAMLLDVRMPGLDGLEVLERLQAIDTDLPVIMVTAYDDVETAVKAMHLGAYHYLSKPFHGDEVVAVVARALEHRRLSREVRTLHERLGDGTNLTTLLGSSAAVRRLAEQVERLAEAGLPVLVTGEHGTGKALVARAIHTRSDRRQATFLALDCGAVPMELLEGELFGHERGAGPEAHRPRAGQVELASGGTLYLADVGSLPLSAQSRLLRLLHDQCIQHLGGEERIPVDVRLVLGSSIDLRELVAGHLFRRDLYAHIAEAVIAIPPLRERKDDLLYLLKRFVDETSRELGKSVQGPTPAALDLLLAHPWPGNLRELRHVVKRAVLLADERIEPDHLGLSPPAASRPAEPASLDEPPTLPLRERTRRAVERVERAAIDDALRRTGGNKSAAARILGIDYKTLHVKLNKYDLRGAQEHAYAFRHRPHNTDAPDSSPHR